MHHHFQKSYIFNWFCSEKKTKKSIFSAFFGFFFNKNKNYTSGKMVLGDPCAVRLLKSGLFYGEKIQGKKNRLHSYIMWLFREKDRKIDFFGIFRLFFNKSKNYTPGKLVQGDPCTVRLLKSGSYHEEKNNTKKTAYILI